MAVSRYIIYALSDPRTNEIRYVGKSSSGLTRPKTHVHPSRLRRKSRNVNWLKSLLASGYQPVIEILEETTAKDLSDAEIFWISYWRFIGADLNNHTSGGDGQLGVRFSTERRQKISEGRGGLTLEQKYEAAHLYSQGMSLRRVASSFKTGSKVIFRALHMLGVPVRTRSEARRLHCG